MKARERLIYTIDKVSYERIRYGDEKEGWGAQHSPCHDCATVEGRMHVPGCDAERCPKCKRQAISCPCRYGLDNPVGVLEARDAILAIEGELPDSIG